MYILSVDVLSSNIIHFWFYNSSVNKKKKNFRKKKNRNNTINKCYDFDSWSLLSPYKTKSYNTFVDKI